METQTTDNTVTQAPAARSLGLFFDTETTCMILWKEPSDHPDQPHIVQLAAKLVDLDTREVIKSMDVLVKPEGWTSSAEALAVHGITEERATVDGIPEADAVRQFLDMAAELSVEEMVIGHNVTFDQRIVRIAIKRHLDVANAVEGAIQPSDVWKAVPAFCTMWKSKPHTKLPGNKHPKLTEAYQHFIGKPMEGAHSAGGDVDGCIAVYFAIKAAEARA